MFCVHTPGSKATILLGVMRRYPPGLGVKTPRGMFVLLPGVRPKDILNASVLLPNNPPENGFVAQHPAFVRKHLCTKQLYQRQIATFLLKSPVFSPISGRVYIMDWLKCSIGQSDGDPDSPCKTSKPQISLFCVYANVCLPQLTIFRQISFPLLILPCAMRIYIYGGWLSERRRRQMLWFLRTQSGGNML